MTFNKNILTIAAAFDPKPFIRTFEGVIEELHQLKIRVQEQCNELENSTRTAEMEYRQNVGDLHGAFAVRNNSHRSSLEWLTFKFAHAGRVSFL